MQTMSSTRPSRLISTERDKLASTSGHGANSVVSSATSQPAQIIPYHPSQITIEKEPSRRGSSSVFCQSRNRAALAAKQSRDDDEALRSSLRVKGPLKLGVPSTNSGSVGDTASLSERGSTVLSDSDFSDNLSVVSDLSDLSVISSLPSFSASGHLRSQWLSGEGSKGAIIIPEVHGGRRRFNSNKVKCLAKRIALLQSEKEIFERQLSINSMHKSELGKVKEKCFELQRENVNLKSQVESLQTLQKSFLGNMTAASEHDTAAEQRSKQPQNVDMVSIHEFRAQLRKAHDEIFRLQNEDARVKSAMRLKSKELETLKASFCQASEENQGLRATNKGLEERVQSLQAALDNIRSVSSEEENQVALLRSDVDSARKASQWYSEQLQSAQKQRSEAQEELVALKKEMSARSVHVSGLEQQVEELSVLLEREKQKYSHEKADFTQKLQKIELEMLEQESQLDQIQTEKDSMITDLSERLAEEEGISQVTENIKALEEDMKLLRQSLEAKDVQLSAVKAAKCDAETRAQRASSEVDSLRSQLQTALAEGQELTLKISGLEVDLGHRNRLIQGYKVDVQKNARDLTALVEAKDSLETTLELVQMELEDKKSAMEETARKEEDLEKRVEELEQELLEQHQLLDNLHAENLNRRDNLLDVERKCAEATAESESLRTQKEEVRATLASVSRELEKSTTRAAQLSEDLDVMTARYNQKRTPTPEPDIRDLQLENTQLRQKVLGLEQFENEVTELRQENDALLESKAALTEKLLEAEKVYFDEEERLRQLLHQREELIDRMKADIEKVERDLCDTKHLLDQSSEQREQINQEQLKKLEDLEEELAGYTVAKKELLEKEHCLVQRETLLQQVRDDNDILTEQISKTCGRIEHLEVENARLKHALEEAVIGEEELKELQGGRINRLETFIAEYEKEIEQLSADKTALQQQIISLEDANGKLSSECVLNDSLREQVLQLQKDLKNDTILRQDLTKSIEAARYNMGKEVASLESALASEKQLHDQARLDLNELKIENVALSQEISALCQRSDDLKHENQLLEGKIQAMEDRVQSGSSSSTCSAPPEAASLLRVKELEHLLEENKRSMCSMEDHISTLKFHLTQKSTELEETKRTFKTATEKFDVTSERLRDSQERLKAEVAGHVQTNIVLREERDGYRCQVTEMNLALRKSLSHIKDLRSKASCPSSPLPADMTDISWIGDLQRPITATIASSPVPKTNLSNLQNCLASLKAEMTVLQSKLAPAKLRSRPESRSSSAPSSPEKTRGAAELPLEL